MNKEVNKVFGKPSADGSFDSSPEDTFEDLEKAVANPVLQVKLPPAVPKSNGTVKSHLEEVLALKERARHLKYILWDPEEYDEVWARINAIREELEALQKEHKKEFRRKQEIPTRDLLTNMNLALYAMFKDKARWNADELQPEGAFKTVGYDWWKEFQVQILRAEAWIAKAGSWKEKRTRVKSSREELRLRWTDTVESLIKEEMAFALGLDPIGATLGDIVIKLTQHRKNPKEQIEFPRSKDISKVPTRLLDLYAKYLKEIVMDLGGFLKTQHFKVLVGDGVDDNNWEISELSASDNNEYMERVDKENQRLREQEKAYNKKKEL